MAGLGLGFMHPDEKRLPIAALLDVSAQLLPPEFGGDALCPQEPSLALPISPTAALADAISSWSVASAAVVVVTESRRPSPPALSQLSPAASAS